MYVHADYSSAVSFGIYQCEVTAGGERLSGVFKIERSMYIYLYVYVITPFRVFLLFISPTPEGVQEGGLINRNNTMNGVIKCLCQLLGYVTHSPRRAP